MKTTFQHTLAAMPARQLNLMAIGVVAIAAALAWTLALRAPLAALRQQQLRLAGMSAAAAGPVPRAPGAPAAAVAPAPAAPAPLDLIAAVSASARAAGLAVGGAVPGAERSVAGLRQQTLAVEASGGYGAILDWLADIETHQPAVGITRLDLRAAPDEPLRLVQVELATYGAERKP